MNKLIKKHFDSEYPQEGCGVLAVHKGKKIWIPCKNIDKEDDAFTIDPKEYLEISHKYDVLAIVHNHIHAPATPSDRDVIACNAIGVPFIIYSYPSMEKYTLSPRNVANSQIGKEYEFDKNDCLSLCTDYYKKNLGVTFPLRKTYKDDWWLQGEDYITEEHLKTWGFYPVENYRKHDLLVFAVEHTINNHLGIALEGDIFLHHAVNRLSCRENLYPFWGKYITQAYRYEA